MGERRQAAPAPRRRRRTPVVLQNAATDCGAAALTMVLGRLGIDVTIREVRTALDAGRDGSTAAALRAEALRHGVRSRGTRLPPDRLDAATLGRLPLPAIAHWDHHHYVVLDQVRTQDVSIIDPRHGRRRVSYADLAAHSTGVLLFFEANADADAGRRPPRKPAPPRPFRLIGLPLLRAHRGALTVLIGASLLLSVLGLAVPLAIVRLVDGFTEPASASLILGIAVLVLLLVTLSTARALVAVRLERAVGCELMTTTVDRLLHAEYAYFERRNIGDLLVRVASADGIRDALVGGLTSAVLALATSLGYLIAVLVLSPALAGVTLALVTVEVFVIAGFARRAGRAVREEVAARGVTQLHVASAISGIAVVRAGGATRTVQDRWARAFADELDAYARRSRVVSFADVLAHVSRVAVPVLLLGAAALVVTSGPGRAIAAATIAAAAIGPVIDLSGQLFTLSAVLPDLDQLDDIWSAAPEPRTGLRPVPHLDGRVELHDVSFRYDAHAAPVLTHIDLTIPAGSKVAIVGRSGSGKSTLVKLLAGLHEPTDGQLRFDGIPAAELDFDSLRRHLGVVLQGSYPPVGTIRDTITLARPEATDAQIVRAARRAAIHDEIAALPLGYDTPIGGTGALSGGQLQRLGLARALLGEPRLLILDEATSALDVHTEAVVEANLRSIGITRIVVAHRLSTITDADLIVTLDQGAIVQAEPGGGSRTRLDA